MTRRSGRYRHGRVREKSMLEESPPWSWRAFAAIVGIGIAVVAILSTMVVLWRNWIPLRGPEARRVGEAGEV